MYYYNITSIKCEIITWLKVKFLFRWLDKSIISKNVTKLNDECKHHNFKIKLNILNVY